MDAESVMNAVQVIARIKRSMAQNERSVDDVLLHNPRTQRALELFGPLVL